MSPLFRLTRTSPAVLAREPKTTDSRVGTFVQWLCLLAVIILCAGQPVPGINESHYLPKAKHALDPEFAPGDLFLESHNSHLLATYFAGILALWLPLTAVAWTGRLIAWSLLAWAWLRLGRSLHLPSWLNPIALASWYFAVYYGHWAGEWAIGGFEGKAVAYPLVLLGISDAVRDRWKTSWLWLAASVAWHPLVGGWAGLTVGGCWLMRNLVGANACADGGDSSASISWRQQLPWWVAAVFISLIGILPALGGIGGQEQQGSIVASQVHVYMRLAHHLCPLTFAAERHAAALCSLGLLIASTIAWNLSRLTSNHLTARSDARTVCYRVGGLLTIAWLSVLIASIGLAVDFLFSRTNGPFPQPLLASKILRFYWFRWADVAVPLGWTLCAWSLASQFCKPGAEKPSLSESLAPSPKRDDRLSQSVTTDRTGHGVNSSASFVASSFGRVFAQATLSISILITLTCIGLQLVSEWNQTIPPADQLVVNTYGNQRKIEWEGSESDRYTDWLAVCKWIRSDTPSDSLWLTPKYQQSFKWHAQRAEVVCWKDVPQDSASVVEWYRRITQLEPPRNQYGQIRGWTDEELRQLSREYDFEYVLVDRTYYPAQEPPPKLEIVYPTDVDNRSFAVFRIRQF